MKLIIIFKRHSRHHFSWEINATQTIHEILDIMVAYVNCFIQSIHDSLIIVLRELNFHKQFIHDSLIIILRELNFHKQSTFVDKCIYINDKSESPSLQKKKNPNHLI